VTESAGEGLDELYGAPLSDFVSARNELARRLRAEGKKEEADEVAALKKPAVAVWVVNQLARRQRRDVDRLLDVGHRLRAAHGETDPEKARKAFDSAREAEREALARLTKAIADLLEEEQGTASQAMFDRVVATLRAAAVTEEGRELLARGRLTEELTTTGFELAAGLTPKSPSPRVRRPKGDVAAARSALDEAKARQRDAERRVRDAESDVADARRALESAEAAVEKARAEAAEAASGVEDAAAELERAKRSG
jgi:hypothetical protein